MEGGAEPIRPLGLLSVYMVRWKLLMRKVTLKGKGGGWESPLDKEEEDEFRRLLRDLNELREIRFPNVCNPWKGSLRNSPNGLRGWVAGSLLYPSLPAVGKRRRYSLLSADHRKDGGGPAGEDDHLKDGTCGSSQLGKIDKKDQGGNKDTPCRNKVLYRLVGRLGHASNGVRQVQRVRGGQGERS